jgi:uncharacterized protein YqgC (DUF456 family)
MDVVLLVLLHLAVLAGLLAVILGLGGNFILLGLALLVAWIGDFRTLGPGLWLGLLALAVGGEILEWILGVLMAKRFGATRWGMIGAFAGGLVGAAVGTAMFPVLGSLLGALLGGFLGALGGEIGFAGRGAAAGLKAGTGAFLGRLVATGAKLLIGLVIAWFTLRAAYPLV